MLAFLCSEQRRFNHCITHYLQAVGVDVIFKISFTPIRAEVRLYDRLFKVENPDGGEGNFKDYINSDSLQVVSDAVIESSLLTAKEGEHYQFIRKGYFCIDKDSKPGHLVFNRTVTLKDTWAKAAVKSE